VATDPHSEREAKSESSDDARANYVHGHGRALLTPAARAMGSAVLVWRVLFVLGLVVLLGLWLDRVLTRRKLRRLIRDRERRRWYVLMQQVAQSSKLRGE
jgi:heme exporter protein D